MDDDTTSNSNMLRRTSGRTRKVATKMVAALASSDNRTQAALARLEALENDNPGAEMVEINSDEDASLDDDDQGYTKKQSKSTKRKTRQAKALENAKKAPRTFLELLQEVAHTPYVASFSHLPYISVSRNSEIDGYGMVGLPNNPPADLGMVSNQLLLIMRKTSAAMSNNYMTLLEVQIETCARHLYLPFQPFEVDQEN